ncbi:hypothetical protein FRC06_003770 [Ceratobasidium sp. 370]|nr:hypothetical protein FRC06_003770 [Ceratobasidium sp. 370]
MNVTSVSIQFLWLLLEQRGRLPITEHPEVREYAIRCFKNLRFILDRHPSSQDERYMFAKMIANDEIVSLAGRVLLLTTDEGNEFQNTEWLGSALEQLVGLKDVFTLATSVAPELFYDSRIEWHKVMAYIGQPVEMGMVNFKDKDSHATYYLSDFTSGSHWELATPESHKVACSPPKADLALTEGGKPQKGAV